MLVAETNWSDWQTWASVCAVAAFIASIVIPLFKKLTNRLRLSYEVFYPTEGRDWRQSWYHLYVHHLNGEPFRIQGVVLRFMEGRRAEAMAPLQLCIATESDTDSFSARPAFSKGESIRLSQVVSHIDYSIFERKPIKVRLEVWCQGRVKYRWDFTKDFQEVVDSFLGKKQPPTRREASLAPYRISAEFNVTRIFDDKDAPPRIVGAEVVADIINDGPTAYIHNVSLSEASGDIQIPMVWIEGLSKGVDHPFGRGEARRYRSDFIRADDERFSMLSQCDRIRATTKGGDPANQPIGRFDPNSPPTAAELATMENRKNGGVKMQPMTLG